MVKIVVLVVLSSVIILWLKSINSELYTLALIACGILIISFALEYILETFTIINKIVELCGIDNQMFLIIFKITSIGYLVEFGSGMVEDMGLKGLAEKLVFVGRLAILTVSLPVFYSVINLLVGLIG